MDERGSDVLEVPECRQLLAIGAAHHRVGHVAVSGADSPTVLPVDYTVDGADVILQVGEGLFANIVGRLVAFAVDDDGDERPWSVLVRGLAREVPWEEAPSRIPSPRPARPGSRLVRIRSDIVTGRRLGVRPAQ